MQANELLGRTAGRDGWNRQYETGERVEDRGHAITMTRKQEVEDDFKVQWSKIMSFSHIKILLLEATEWHAWWKGRGSGQAIGKVL